MCFLHLTASYCILFRAIIVSVYVRLRKIDIMAQLLRRRSSMKNNSFDRAMGQIVAQAEAEREQEIKARQRAEWFGRVRNAFILLFITTVLIFAYNFHDRLG